MPAKTVDDRFAPHPVAAHEREDGALSVCAAIRRDAEELARAGDRQAASRDRSMGAVRLRAKIVSHFNAARSGVLEHDALIGRTTRFGYAENVAMLIERHPSLRVFPIRAIRFGAKIVDRGFLPGVLRQPEEHAAIVFAAAIIRDEQIPLLVNQRRVRSRSADEVMNDGVVPLRSATPQHEYNTVAIRPANSSGAEERRAFVP